ncbi:MAG TPA: transcriptional repressor LexA [Bryobacteraceae bacterium]|nr:transcriptional repressor LexA [Bryobacteraceae bacterium]
MALTRRQKDVLDFISSFIKQHGYSPSFEEIADGLGLASLATVHKHIQALEAKHYLHRNYNHSRSLEIGERYLNEERARHTEEASSYPAIRLLGRIAAGSPVEAIPNTEMLHFADFAGDTGTFALQVRGESMIDDHICNGDFVLVQKTDTVRNGDIVVALVDSSEATLKRFYNEPDGRVRLQPANAAMEPIFVDSSRLEIQGRVLAVMRKY